MPKFEDHDCSLPTPEEDLVKIFVGSGLFISCRRTLRELCMLDKKHPETARVFKSHAARRSEQIRHLMHHYRIVHPFSTLQIYWEFYMFLLLTIHFTMIPLGTILVALYDDFTPNYYQCKIIVELLYLFDVVKNFFTGYYDKEKSRVILAFPRIAKRYLKSYFFIDIVSCTHLYFFLFGYTGFEKYNTAVFALRILNRLKIARLGRWLDQLELFRQYMGYSSYVFKGIRMVLVYLVLTFWGFSIYFFMNNFTRIHVYGTHIVHWTGRLFKRSYDAILMMLVVKYGRYDIDEWWMYVTVFFFLCFGYILQLYLYMLQIWTQYTSGENQQYDLHMQFKEYMTYKKLPISLRKRIMSYFNFKFHKHFFKESDITGTVSHSLKQEILLHVMKKHIEGVEFFKYLPQHILLKMVAHLKLEVFLPRDVIVTAGTEGNSMFLIHHGTVAVYTPTGKEICHLTDGDHFGEIALILSETRVATVVAVSASELYILKRSDFFFVIEPFPELKAHVISLATERMTKTILQDK